MANSPRVAELNSSTSHSAKVSKSAVPSIPLSSSLKLRRISISIPIAAMLGRLLIAENYSSAA